MALVTVQAMAQDPERGLRKQERPERVQRHQDFTPEEMAALRTKQMVLDLDLSQSQQDKIYKINLERAKERKQGIEERKQQKKKAEDAKPSKEERLQRMNARLDRQIAIKKQMKDILNKEQYDKWSEKSARHRSKRKSAHKRKRKE